MSKNNFIYKNIPNFFTLMNLLSGMIAIVLAAESENSLVLASYFIYAASVFDFFDGFSARTLKATSKIGKELDSLADMVSFGVAPSMILFQLLKSGLQIKQFSFSLPATDIAILFSAFLIAIFSAIRLAKFNTDDSQKEVFKGLATPASAMLIASIPLIADFNLSALTLFPGLSKVNKLFFLTLGLMYILKKAALLVPLSIIISALLVAPMPMFSLKFKNYSFEDNALKYIFLIFSAISFAVLEVLAIPIIFILYVSFSVFNNIFTKKEKKNDQLVSRQLKK